MIDDHEWRTPTWGRPRRPTLRKADDLLRDLGIVLLRLLRCVSLIATGWTIVDVALHGPWWWR